MIAKRLLLLLSLFLAGASGHAGPWHDLFDGKSLDGWIQRNGQAPYTIEDGCIVGTTRSGTPNSFLCTDKTYRDFIFEFELKQEGRTNSGVQFRSLSTEDYRNGRVHGYQCEVDPSPRAWTGGIYDEARRGWLSSPETNPRAKSAYQYGRWNLFRIEAIGNSLRTWINGIPVAHVIDDLTPEGFIALQVHSIEDDTQPGARILWRNIRIQTEDLCPSPIDEELFVRNVIPNHLSEVEQQQGWSLLWDGKTTNGWRLAGADDFPVGTWEIHDGELVLPEKSSRKNSERAGIVTTSRYGAFELQLEFKLEHGGNSGIKYFIQEGGELSPGGGLGLEYQLLDNQRHPDAEAGAAGNRTLASLYDLIPSRKTVSTRAVPANVDYWHHVRIVAHPGGLVEHWLDGFKVVEFEHGSPLFQALVERSKYGKYKDFSMVKSSPILLQDHSDPVKFRSIKIREIK